MTTLDQLARQEGLDAWITGFAIVLGLFLGSFLNVVIHRLPRGENLAFPGSHCPACHAPIRVFDNIPLLSWLILRGRARCCKATIPARYPLVELLGGLLTWAVLRTQIWPLDAETPVPTAVLLFVLYSALGLSLIALAFIDLEYMILPDPLTLGGAALGLATAELRPGQSLLGACLGALLGFLAIWLLFDVLYSKLRGYPGMGLGDAKLVMMAGAWFGWTGALFALLAGAVQATFLALPLYFVRGKLEEPEAVVRERLELEHTLKNATPEERARLEKELQSDPLAREPEAGLGKARLAFGPFLALATLEYLLFGDFLIDQYWQLGMP